jgi:DinB superfamily
LLLPETAARGFTATEFAANLNIRESSDMETPTGTQLAQGVRQKMTELKKVCADVDEKTASRTPEGRWSPKEILSHLIGPRESAYLRLFQIFLNKDNPTIELNPGNPFFSEERAKTSFADLLIEVEKSYEQIALFAENLSDEQLARPAHVPVLKESPLGENPSLAAMIKGLGQFHVQTHIEQMIEVLQALAQ